MSTILLQTTITDNPDDWHVGRFSLLAGVLRAAGHQVVARNRLGGDDPVLSHVDQLGYHQLWLLAVDVGEGLTDAEAAAILRFRGNGGGLLTARDHQDLGCCLRKLGSVGQINRFHDEEVDPATMCDDQDTPAISWPNFHSGANGDYQPVFVERPFHDVLRTTRTASGRIEWFPAHPHEGLVTADLPFATCVAQGRSTATARRFTLAVALDGERTAAGRPMGRAVAESTFHHFADYNWNVDRGAPSFVTEPPGTQIAADPARLEVFMDYVRNLGAWLHPTDARLAPTGGQDRALAGHLTAGRSLIR